MKKLLLPLLLLLANCLSAGAQTAHKSDERREAIAFADKLFEKVCGARFS